MRDYASTLPVAFASDLFQSGWDGEFLPYPGITTRQFAMQHAARALVKKFKPRSTKLPDAKALELFVKNNDRCREYTWDTSRLHELDYLCIEEAKNFINKFCESYCPTFDVFESLVNTTSLTQEFGLGNGSNIGSPGIDFFSKLSLSSMATTNRSLYDFFVQAISSDPVWSNVESIRHGRRGVEIAQGSRVSFVPKTAEISRTICTEPVLNMLFQKGIGRVLERQLIKVLGIDLETQADINRNLAHVGSLTGKFGTIDLSSASDTISLTLVRKMFPRQMLYWLELTRSPNAVLPDGTVIEMHMVSSMGNAFTFPLQTLLFSSLVYGAYKVLGIKLLRSSRHKTGNFAVFGDDIIVESKSYDLICRLLSFCGFQVNVDKSFNQGLFRESCGRDYWYGYGVRGVYIQNLRANHDYYSAINRLLRWSALHEIPIPNTVKHLLEGIKGRKFLVPFDEDDTAGLKVPSVVLPKIPTTDLITYRCLGLRGKDIDIHKSKQLKSLKGWFPNHEGLLLAVLAGKLRLGRISLRIERPIVRVKSRCTPRWDYIHLDGRFCARFDRNWKIAVMNVLV